MFRSDGSSFSDSPGVGPADDIIPQGRVYCYSSDEDDAKTTLPLHQRIKRSRFVSRIQEERIHIKDKLDMEQFQPMMTSEKLDSVTSSPTNILARIKKSTPLQLRPRQTRRCKREAAPVTADDYDDSSRYLRKRNRKDNDYGALSTLGSELLKLDIIESETQAQEVCNE